MSDYSMFKSKTAFVNFDAMLSSESDEKLSRILNHAGYSVSEVRSIWRRSYKDKESFNTILELLATKDKITIARLLDVDLLSLKPRANYDTVRGTV